MAQHLQKLFMLAQAGFVLTLAPLAMASAAVVENNASAMTSALEPSDLPLPKTLKGPIEADVLEVIDGDSMRVRAHIWLGMSVETIVRLKGLDTPELRGKCDEEKAKARAARDALRRLTFNKKVTLSDIIADKYGGRVNAVVKVGVLDLSAEMIKQRHARVYGGEKRQGWCVVALSK